MQYLLIIIKHKLVMLSGIDGLYKISIVNLSLIGDILETAFAIALAAALRVRGTTMILNAWKFEISRHTSCW